MVDQNHNEYQGVGLYYIAIYNEILYNSDSFPWIVPLTLDSYFIIVLSKEASITIFEWFGMTRPGIEPQSLGPLMNINHYANITHAHTHTHTYIYIYKWVNSRTD